jgi:dienelactone hydrolase
MTVPGAKVFSGCVALALHGLLLAALGFALRTPWHFPQLRPLIELDLSETVREAPPVPVPAKVRVPEEPRIMEVRSKPLATPPPPPLPRGAKLSAKPPAAVSAKPETPPPAQAAAPSGPPPKPISEHKEEGPPLNDDPELEAFAKSGGYADLEAPDYLKHGSESRFGHVLGYYTYTIEQYVGQYTYEDGESVTIIDARDTPYGRLLFYDSRTGIFRDLKQFGRYIYSYGPAFGQDEPIVGSLVFLANGDDISRILWMHGGKEAARFPNKIFFAEKDVTFSRGATDLSGSLILPPGEGPFPAVVWLAGSTCGPRKLSEGLARQLAGQNVAVLLFDPRGCGASEGSPGSDQDLAKDALAAVHFLRKQPKIDPRRVGLFARDNGVAAALEAAGKTGGDAPAFLVAAISSQDATPRPATLSAEALRRMAVPSLWLYAGPDPKHTWVEDLVLLEDAPRYGLARVLLLPEEDAPPADAPTWARDAVRLDRMTSGFSRFAGPWISER